MSRESWLQKSALKTLEREEQSLVQSSTDICSHSMQRRGFQALFRKSSALKGGSMAKRFVVRSGNLTSQYPSPTSIVFVGVQLRRWSRGSKEVSSSPWYNQQVEPTWAWTLLISSAMKAPSS
eukprot:CAMPEP_0170575514 /NCGR_PEP_ID=MMETSP0224-20130122/3902_1 /TAXON_ID=285029 /ORGANISM="Togula jolla, Strain CCCM 725" /LENGTH=121 /DNA_ID=CAMNT_0010898299 /DNA_START=61 /DNA_END=423 /DNA_ORIENTATION=-